MAKRQVGGLSCRSPWDARGRQLERLGAELFDVLVIGGGVTGCGVALDAASRGLSVALIEKRDFAAGTSSRSSKLIHGGLRYLERFDLGLVREALHERRLLAERLAPHLVHPTPFLLPLEHGLKDRAYMGAGLLLYDSLAGLHPAMPRHRHLSHAACLRAVPSLREDAVTGGIRYYDAQVDDARFAVTLAGTASAQGACCVPAVEVTDFLHDGAAVAGVHARDLEGDAEFDVRARVTVNATGIWTTEMERLAGVESPLPVSPSKGVHIVVPRDRIDSELALILPTEKSVLFVLPWGTHWIIGTTDTPWEFGLDHPSASRADIDYLLGHANTVLRTPLTIEDITGVYVGLRPLVAEGSADTAAVSREHVVRRSAPGLVSIAGGKYTTYRIMARDAVDVAARDLPFPIPAEPHGGSAAARRRRVGRGRPAGTPPSGRRRPLAAAAGPPRRAIRDDGSAGAGPDRRGPVALRDRWTAQTRTWPPRSGTRCCTKRRCTWTTSSRAARTSPSRSRTAAVAPSTTSRGSWRRCWSGTRRRLPTRSSTTARDSTPRARRRRCWTTPRRTQRVRRCAMYGSSTSAAPAV